MLTEKQLNDYKTELEEQHRVAQADLENAKTMLEQAKANLNAVVGARQAVAHLMSLTTAEEQEAITE